MNKPIILLVFILIVMVALFSFSSWTNAQVVSEDGGSSPEFGLTSKISPFLIGLFLLIGLALVIMVVVNH